MIKILVADDHPLIRKGLYKILEKEKDLCITCELSNGSEVLNYVKNNAVDIVILDLSLPGKNGLDVLKDLKYTFPALPVLILSIHSEERFAIRALKSGASGYLTKETATENLIYAIKKAISGGIYISEELAEKLVKELDYNAEKPLHAALSDREYQVLRMLASGKKVKEIAEDLSLSPRTIYSFRTRIFRKMSMHCEAELIQYSIQNKLVD